MDLNIVRHLVSFLKDRHDLVAYRAALDSLSAVGWVRGYGEPRERFAGRVAEWAPAFDTLTRAHVAAALRPTGATAEDLPLEVLYRTVARQVRVRVPWWRWLLGALNPISWMWSR